MLSSAQRFSGSAVVDVAKAAESRSFVAVRDVAREFSGAKSGFPGRSVPAPPVRWRIGVVDEERRKIFSEICFREQPLLGKI